MKRAGFILVTLVAFSISACNNSNNKKTESKEPLTTIADSLMAYIEDGHNAGMAKYGKLKAMQNKVQQIIDSIGKLPGKTRTSLAPYKANMDSLLAKLNSARAGMDKWMDEFNMDSALNNMEQRIKYLSEEKLKISKIKESILHSLHKADSLTKVKF